MLAPAFGAHVIARDLDRIDVGEATLEAGRLFRATWGFDRSTADHHAVNPVAAFGDRLPPMVHGRVLAIARYCAGAPPNGTEQALGAVAACLVDRLERSHRELADSRTRLRTETELATRDLLTGLPNREGLVRWLGRPDLHGVDTPSIGVVMLDLDRFKVVNDSRGHAVGDALLQSVAKALTETVRAGDMVVRWGGDEFVVLCPGIDAAELGALAERLIRAVSSVNVEGESVGASAGIPLSRRRPLAIDDADDALYRAKRAGGQRVVWLRPGMAEH